MRAITKYVGFVAAILLAMALIGFGQIWHSASKLDEDCNRMVRIASDDEKVAYIRNWIRGKVQSGAIAELLDASGSIRARTDPSRFEKVDLDWELLEIGRAQAVFSLFRGGSDSSEGEDIVESVLVGERRYAMVVAIDPETHVSDSAMRGPWTHYVEVSTSVVVLCN